MGFITTTIRVGIPAGVVYYTCDKGLWSPAVGSDANLKQFHQQDQQVKTWRNQAIDYVNPYVQPYVKKIGDSIKVPDVRGWYSCGVRMTFRSLADFDPAHESKRLVKWIVSQTTSTSPAAISSSSSPPATPNVATTSTKK